MNKIECIIMDWAGTAIDYGCFAPVAAFIESFKTLGLEVTADETRAHMGLTKIEEIRMLLSIPRINACFWEKYGRSCNDEDVQLCYTEFQRVLFASLEDYTDPLPGVVVTISELRSEGIRVGSTSGYTRKMMDVIIPVAERKGYVVDNCVTSDNLPAGRPSPYMIFQNMCELGISSCQNVVKIGDTIADIKEGLNAGVWSVGIVLGSNELALTETEVRDMKAEELIRRMAQVRLRMLEAGAHYVIDSVDELPDIIQAINRRQASLLRI